MAMDVLPKFGVVFCGYNSEEYIHESLKNIIQNPKFIISAVSVPFLEYCDQEFFEDGTTNILKDYFDKGLIHNLVTEPRFIKESEARNLALDFLKKFDLKYYMCIDSDEFFTKEDLNKIIQFIEKDSASEWWRLSLKNYVFDDKTYLKEPFCPPRIFRAKLDYLYNPSFYGDNDIQYFKSTGEAISYLYLPNQTVPKETAWIKHLTWLNNKIGKRKVEYQTQRWGENSCSFAWDEEKGLCFNEEYFRMKGEKIPETLKD